MSPANPPSKFDSSTTGMPLSNQSWAKSCWHATISLLDRLAKDKLVLFLALILMSTCWLPYCGLKHDARLYALQVLDHIEDGRYAGDLYLRYGSQDSYTIFSAVVSPIAELIGIEATFFVVYLIGNALFLWSLMRLIFALVPSQRTAVLTLLYVAATPIAFGGLRVFHVNESFLTPRIIAVALVLLACERILQRRFVVALVCLVAALLFHPIMAFCGLLVWTGAVALEQLTLRQIIWGVALAACAVTGVLLNSAVGIRIFGEMDATWNSLVHDSNFCLFPTEWMVIDWLRIGMAFLVAVSACLSSQLPTTTRRFAGLVTFVAAVGTLFGLIAPQLPYALLFQGQPYRALWLLQLLAVPMAGMLIEQQWNRGGSANRILAIALGSWFAFDSVSLWISMMLLFTTTLAALRLAKKPLSTATFAIAALSSATLVCICNLIDWSANLPNMIVETREYAHLISWSQLPKCILGPLLTCVVSMRLLYGLWDWCGGRRRLCAAMLGLFFLLTGALYYLQCAPSSQRLPTARHSDIEFVHSFLNSQRRLAAENRSPDLVDSCQVESVPNFTIHWPICDTKELWFDLHVNCYFSWTQLYGNMFNRSTATEGHRRAELVRPFDQAAYRDWKLITTPWQQRSLNRLYGSAAELAKPSTRSLFRLCQDDTLDYVILRHNLDDLYEVTDGKLYIYDCKKLRQLLAHSPPHIEGTHIEGRHIEGRHTNAVDAVNGPSRRNGRRMNLGAL